MSESYDDSATCWNCRRYKNICLDCPWPKAGNDYRYRRYKLQGLNVLRELVMDDYMLPHTPINPIN